MDAEKFLEKNNIIILHSNIYLGDIAMDSTDILDDLTDEDLLFDLDNGTETKRNPDQLALLINYIQSKLDIKIPDKIILNILNLEAGYNDKSI